MKIQLKKPWISTWRVQKESQQLKIMVLKEIGAQSLIIPLKFLGHKVKYWSQKIAFFEKAPKPSIIKPWEIYIYIKDLINNKIQKPRKLPDILKSQKKKKNLYSTWIINLKILGEEIIRKHKRAEKLLILFRNKIIFYHEKPGRF